MSLHWNGMTMSLRSMSLDMECEIRMMHHVIGHGHSVSIHWKCPMTWNGMTWSFGVRWTHSVSNDTSVAHVIHMSQISFFINLLSLHQLVESSSHGPSYPCLSFLMTKSHALKSADKKKVLSIADKTFVEKKKLIARPPRHQLPSLYRQGFVGVLTGGWGLRGKARMEKGVRTLYPQRPTLALHILMMTAIGGVVWLEGGEGGGGCPFMALSCVM